MWQVAGFGSLRHQLSQFLTDACFDHRQVIVNSGPLEGPCSEVSDDVLRPVAAVECPRKAKGRRGVLLSTLPTAGRANISWKRLRTMSRSASPLNVRVDPLPGLVEGRFRVLSERTARGNQDDRDAFERRVDEALRRARRLDEQIVRTIATSTLGLLAQLRLLSAFFDESTNGAGRRGALLQSIAAGIERLDAGDPAISSGTTMNAVDRSYSTHREIDGSPRLEQVRGSEGTRHPLMSLPLQRVSRCH
jgi:hypothetical protein